MANPIIQADNIFGVPFRVAILPSNKPNWTGVLITASNGATIHETANQAPGADAEMHRRFVWNGGGGEGVSFTFVVDDTEIIQLLPLNIMGIHAGDATGNRTSWGIELCVNSNGDFERTKANAAKLVRFLWQYEPVSNGKYRQHNGWSGKNCPARMRARSWQSFVVMLQEGVGPPPVEFEVIDSGFYGKRTVKGLFRLRWNERDRIANDGLPLTDEIVEVLDDGQEHIVQYFERDRYELHGGDVLHGRIGAELLEQRERKTALHTEIARLQELIATGEGGGLAEEIVLARMEELGVMLLPAFEDVETGLALVQKTREMLAKPI